MRYSIRQSNNLCQSRPKNLHLYPVATNTQVLQLLLNIGHKSLWAADIVSRARVIEKQVLTTIEPVEVNASRELGQTVIRIRGCG